jgi:hypothetical protein
VSFVVNFAFQAIIIQVRTSTVKTVQKIHHDMQPLRIEYKLDQVTSKEKEGRIPDSIVCEAASSSLLLRRSMNSMLQKMQQADV